MMLSKKSAHFLVSPRKVFHLFFFPRSEPLRSPVVTESVCRSDSIRFVTSSSFSAIGSPAVGSGVDGRVGHPLAIVPTVLGRGSAWSVLSRMFHLAVQLTAAGTAADRTATDGVLGRVRRHVLDALLHA
uniref:Uncharacterized protein n=1 Tax=Anopheles culicifacies TaxID=139723 RepID=A0A182MRJ1_9DIPT